MKFDSPFIVILIICFVTLTANVVNSEFTDDDFDEYNLENRQINAIQNIDEYKELYPGIRVVHLNRTITDYAITYTLGARRRGERLVGQAGQNVRYSSLHNISLTLRYPSNGKTASMVTYVSVKCSQSSIHGQAYVIMGGINQRFIVIAIESHNTLYLNYNATIYGI